MNNETNADDLALPQKPSQGEPAPEMPLAQRRQWAMFVHLAAFSAYAGVPVGNVLGPIILWQIQKDKVPGLEAHAKDAANFHLAMTIYMLVCFGFSMFCFVGVLPLMGLGLYSTVISVLAAIAANDGKPYRYPGAIELIK